MEAIRIKDMAKGSGWKVLLLALLLVGGLSGKTWAQAQIFTILPAGPYTGGQDIEIQGLRIFDLDPNNCDSLLFKHVSTGTYYRYRAEPSATYPLAVLGPDQFTGNTGPGFSDTVFFTIPCNWPNGVYEVRIKDDEDCNNCVNRDGAIPNNCGWSGAPTITVNNASLADLAFGDSTFCIGEAAPLPTNSMGTGTFVDLNAIGFPLQSMVAIPSSGQLTFHSGVLNGMPSVSHQIRFTSTGPCPSTDVSTVTLKAMQNDSLIYTGNPFCKDAGSVPIPMHVATGVSGTYAVSPSPLTGFDTNTGGVTITAPTAPGQYSVTFTPTANSCSHPTTEQFSIINLDSAIFTYAPVYCNGDPIGGYPSSVISLPAAGGYFKDTLTIGGLIVDSLTGRINLTAGVITGTHTIGYYPTNAGCDVVKYATFLVRDPDPSNFAIINASACANSGPLNLFPLSSGVFYSPTGDIYFSDTIAGVINTDSSSSGGPFLIYHTNNDATCPDTTQGHVTLTPRVIPIVSYGGLLFCENDPSIGVPSFLAGAAGGSFFVDTVGPNFLVLDTSTGIITFNQSDPGTYDIIYNTPGGPGTCAASDTVFGLKIAEAPDATFDFPADSVCFNSGLYDQPATLPSNGDYDRWKCISPTGTVIPGAMVATDDSLDVTGLAVGGPYAIMRTSTKGTCVDSFVDYITIAEIEDAFFEYVPDTFCGIDQNPTPSIFYVGGGTYSNGSTANLVFADTSVGMVDLLASSVGDHYIIYTTPGFCKDSDTAFLYIRDALNPSFAYSRYIFCETTTDTLYAIYDDSVNFQPGTVTFSSVPPRPAELDDTLGTLLLASLPPDTYRVTMTLVNLQQACLAFYYEDVIISAQNSDSNATLVYDKPSYCVTEDSAVATLNVQVNDGIFFGSPNTLVWQNRSVGLVDIDNTQPGGYLITYVKQNACLDVLEDSIRISVPINPTLVFLDADSLPSLDYCKSDSLPPIARLTPFSPGIFSAINLQDTSLHMVFTDDSLGVIDLRNTPAGVYEVRFTEISGCTGSGAQRIRINSGPTIDLYILQGDTLCAGDLVTIDVNGGNDYDLFINGIFADDTIFSTSDLTDGQIVSTEARDILGCIATDSIEVQVYPVPVGIVAQQPGTISGATPIHFEMGTTAPNTYFVWTATAAGSVTIPTNIDSTFTNLIDPGQFVPIDLNQSLASDITPGVVTFKLVPKAEICEGDTQIVRVFINPNDSAIFVPEVFTPNTEDDVNSTWLIQWRDDITPEDYEIFIYNRSGGLVDHLDRLMNTWNGNNLPDGVYWYLIKRRSSNYQLKGGLTIRRK